MSLGDLSLSSLDLAVPTASSSIVQSSTSNPPSLSDLTSSKTELTKVSEYHACNAPFTRTEDLNTPPFFHEDSRHTFLVDDKIYADCDYKQHHYFSNAVYKANGTSIPWISFENKLHGFARNLVAIDLPFVSEASFIV